MRLVGCICTYRLWTILELYWQASPWGCPCTEGKAGCCHVEVDLHICWTSARVHPIRLSASCQPTVWLWFWLQQGWKCLMSTLVTGHEWRVSPAPLIWVQGLKVETWIFRNLSIYLCMYCGAPRLISLRHHLYKHMYVHKWIGGVSDKRVHLQFVQVLQESHPCSPLFSLLIIAGSEDYSFNVYGGVVSSQL
jgi:hypothetical protein